MKKHLHSEQPKDSASGFPSSTSSHDNEITVVPNNLLLLLWALDAKSRNLYHHVNKIPNTLEVYNFLDNILVRLDGTTSELLGFDLFYFSSLNPSLGDAIKRKLNVDGLWDKHSRKDLVDLIIIKSALVETWTNTFRGASHKELTF